MKFKEKMEQLAELMRLPGRMHDLEHRQESRLNRMIEMFREKPEAAPVATLLVIGQTANSYKQVYVRPREEGPPENQAEKPFTACWAQSKAVPAGRNSTELRVEPMRPVEASTLVVLADVERVEVQGLFVGVDCVVLGSPLGFFAGVIVPGQLVRAMVYRREPSGK